VAADGVGGSTGSGCVAVWQLHWFLNGVDRSSIDRDMDNYVAVGCGSGSGSGGCSGFRMKSIGAVLSEIWPWQWQLAVAVAVAVAVWLSGSGGCGMTGCRLPGPRRVLKRQWGVRR
jgi:hypothetical protein